MKKYVKPMMDGEVFVSNEYVSACYFGFCNISGAVYTDNNKNGVYDKDIDTYLYENTACKEQFEITGASSTKPTANAFVVGKQFHIPGHWTTVLGVPIFIFEGKPGFVDTVTPVYHFNRVHVSTLDNIIQNESKPNHS